ncbi:MAG: F0F1 ATP synthase subunit C [Arsenophonus sp. NC-QC1-MAG3]
MVTSVMIVLTTISAAIGASIPKGKIFRRCCSLTNLISLSHTQFFIVITLIDTILMIAVGLEIYVICSQLINNTSQMGKTLIC